MKTLLAGQMDELWEVYWKDMSAEWFKLEILQDYSAEDDSPSLRAWLKGDKRLSLNLLKEDDDPLFTEECRQKAAQGADLIRAHVIEQPLSPYMQWELEYYKRVSIPRRGEKVFILDASRTAGLRLPAGDIIVFDRRRVILNSYGPDGLLAGADFYDEKDDLQDFLKLRKVVLTQAQKLIP